MPASRVVVNTPTTHGAIGFSTALPPSMTLGCGSWGGNVTSDNVSPLHLMDIKRVAFETKPVKSARPALAAQPSAAASQQPAAPAQTANAPHAIGRAEIASIVDRFLANRGAGQQASPQPHEHATLHASSSPAQYQPVLDIEAGSRYDRSEAAPQATAAPTAAGTNGGNGNDVSPVQAKTHAPTAAPAPAPSTAQQGASAPAAGPAAAATNGNARKTVDFVSEDDVRRAIQKGEKIYVNARTIITPSAHDMGDPAEVFAKA
jgi:acetaldehyde dehydrogenase (acetylating)